MAEPDLAPSRTARPDPFVFPSDTDFRFALLIIVVIASSLFLYNWLFNSIPALSGPWARAIVRCPAEANAAFPAGTDFDYLAQRHDFTARCLLPYERTRAAWMVAGAALVTLVAVALYLLYPAWIVRRGRLEPVRSDDAPEVLAAVEELSREAGLARPPRLLWNPRDPTPNGGQAFGRPGAHVVALTGGLVTQWYVDPDGFRAVLRHELAHLRHGDVGKAYFANAIWYAFVGAALIPFALSFLDRRERWATAIGLGWRVLALTMLVFLVRAAILRAREFAADLRASAQDGTLESLNRLLAASPEPRTWRERGPLALHPSPRERRRVLDDPTAICRLNRWEAFGVGVATSVAIVDARMLIDAVNPNLLVATLGPVLAFAPLAAGYVGLGLWRSTFAALVRQAVPRGAGRAGLCLALGIAVGQVISFGTWLPTAPGAEFLISPLSLVPILLMGAVLLATLPFFMRWIVAAAAVWLERVAPGRTLRAACAVTLAAAGLVLVVWLGALSYGQRLAETLLDATDAGALATSLGQIAFLLGYGAILLPANHPLTALALVSFWAVPLAAAFRRLPAPERRGIWPVLDPAPAGIALAHGAPLRLRAALLLGLVGGLLGGALLLFVRLILRLGLSEADRDAESARILSFVLHISLALLVQMGTAGLAALWIRRLGAVHGLLAAFAAGCVLVAALLGLNLAFGGSLDASFAWLTFTYVVNCGAVLSVPLALLAAGTASWFRAQGGGVANPGARSSAAVATGRPVS